MDHLGSVFNSIINEPDNCCKPYQDYACKKILHVHEEILEFCYHMLELSKLVYTCIFYHHAS